MLSVSYTYSNSKQSLSFEQSVIDNLGPINLCVIKQTLSPSYLETIEHLAWRVSQFDDLCTLSKKLSNAKTSMNKNVLLIDEEVFSQQKLVAESAGINWSTQFDLIGLCQPTMGELNSDICQQLDELDIAYILLDTPLYRYALEQIISVLINEPPKDKIKLNESIEVATVQPKISLKSTSSVLLKESSDDLCNVSVLLVEDNLVNQLVAKELLMSLKATVTIADNGQHALDLLDKIAVDVVLMDIQMPIMDGLTATIAIRKQKKYQHLPIICH